MSSLFRMGRALRGLLITACTLAMVPTGAGAQQVIEVAGGNSASNEILSLDFPGAAAIVLNNDANTRASLRSFEFYKNTCAKRLDLIAADTNRGEILLYNRDPSNLTDGQGPGDVICSGAGCPSRPDGLSASEIGLLSVADTGTAGTTPAVWLFKPAACNGEIFDAPKSGGQFSVGTQGPATPVTGISDTEFVNILGGGLAQGDLLVLTSGPTTLARVRAADIVSLICENQDCVQRFLPNAPANFPVNSGGLPSAQILVDQNFFGSETPTAMAFVPGTGGIGSTTDGVSQSEDLLVTLTGGRVLKLRFQVSGNSIGLAPPDQSVPGKTPLQNRVFLAEGLGNGPLGIDAGTRDEIDPKPNDDIDQSAFMVVADRQQGSFLRYILETRPDGSLLLARNDDGSLMASSIRSGVQNPQGVAINSDAYEASRCQDVPETDQQTGCRLRKTVELHYTQDNLQATDTVFANITFIEDTRGSGGTLPLPGGFKVPASCRGIPLPDDPTSSVLVLVEITKNFEVTAGDFVQSKELVDQIIPQLGGCKDVGTRIFYHPEKVEESPGNFAFDTPENGTLYDATFYCSNPSRSLERDNSPLVICADPFYLQAKASNGGVKGRLAKDFQTEIELRAQNLRVVVNGLTGPVFDTLRATLNGHIDAALQDVKRRDFVAASADFDAGALAVYAKKMDITNASLPPDELLAATYYGDLLGRFLALAFFSKESAGQMAYCPPVLLQEQELTDVSCMP